MIRKFMLLLGCGLAVTNSAFAQDREYSGPVSLKLKVLVFTKSTGEYRVGANEIFFVNTVKNSPENNGTNHYIRTDDNGYASIVLSKLGIGAHITLYRVSAENSTIRVGCKVAYVDGKVAQYLEVPQPKSFEYIEQEVKLHGTDCG